MADALPPGDRIAKVIARAGLASRREAEAMIAAGRVVLNGKPLKTPAMTVGPTDRIVVDGKPLPRPEPPRLWRYHKPKGLITTTNDTDGRETVFDKLPEELPRVLTIGRLDINTEGLLLLTNDGELKRHLELPGTGWLRRYRVRAFGRVTQEALDALQAGPEVEGVRYGPVIARIERQQGDNMWLGVDIREGKNREVKLVLESIGLQVNRLIRTSYGPFTLEELGRGEVREVPRRILNQQLPERFHVTHGHHKPERSVDKDTPTKSKANSRGRPARKAKPASAGPGRTELTTSRPARGKPAAKRLSKGASPVQKPSGRGTKPPERNAKPTGRNGKPPGRNAKPDGRKAGDGKRGGRPNADRRR